MTSVDCAPRVFGKGILETEEVELASPAVVVVVVVEPFVLARLVLPE
jgi:hypothetical protein